MTKTGLIFDFDGPLYDGRAASRCALEQTASRFEAALVQEPPELPVVPLYGPQQLVNLVFAGRVRDRTVLDRILEYYIARLEEAERALPIAREVQDALREMRKAEVRLAVLSSRPFGELKAHLERASLLGCFVEVLGRDSHVFRKPDPAAVRFLLERLDVDPVSAALIGDSDSDYLAASGAGVPYYHAAWTGEPSSIARTKATATLGSPDDYLLFLDEPLRETPAEGRRLPPDLQRAIADGHCCFFAGAGVSVPSGIGAWAAHYQPVLRSLRADLLARDHSLQEALQLIAADPARSNAVFETFSASFEKPAAKPNPYHVAILRARAPRVWTTNYDGLFEAAIEELGMKHLVATSDKELLKYFAFPHLVIKMNGDFKHAQFDPSLEWNLVFLEEQFDLAERTRREIMRLFEDDYRNNSIVFVGISFKDPALRRVLAAAARGIPKTRHPHYLLTKKAAHPLEARTFALYERNLRRRGIRTLFFEDFPDIERFVKQIALAALRPIVGFSGTTRNVADESYGASVLPGGRLTSAQVEAICAAAGRAFAAREFRVCSGHGRGVGVASVNGAFEERPSLARFYLRSRGRSVFSRSAAAVVVPGGSLEAMREIFLSQVDLLVAIGGDTINESTSGTIAEIEWALEHRIPVLLIPQAGGDVMRYSGSLHDALTRVFADVELRDCIWEANRTVAAIAPSDLLRFAQTQLQPLVEEVIAKSMGSIVRRRGDDIAGASRDEW